MVGRWKSSVVWQFASGFVLGAVGLAVLHPTEVRASVAAPATQVAR